jgi:hypothetical protein
MRQRKKENKKYSGKRKQSAFPCCSVSLNLGKTQGHGSVTGWGGVVGPSASCRGDVSPYGGSKDNRPPYDRKPGPDIKVGRGREGLKSKLTSIEPNGHVGWLEWRTSADRAVTASFESWRSLRNEDAGLNNSERDGNMPQDRPTPPVEGCQPARLAIEANKLPIRGLIALMAPLAHSSLARLRLFSIPLFSHWDLVRLVRLVRTFLQAPLQSEGASE